MNEGLYKEITSLVSDDMSCLKSYLVQIATENDVSVGEFQDEMAQYLGGSSKRIRSTLIFLFSRLLYGKVDDKTLKLAAAVEILHNATLIHDDIIDSAKTRRGKTTLHTKYNNRFAIIAGDFLLSMAISELSCLKSIDVIETFSSCLLSLCRGEVEQYFAKNITPTIEEYLEKSEEKTASLFVAALKSLAFINNDTVNVKMLETFAKHFGRAFQIKDDLSNITDENEKKPLYADIENGVYTAPVIYAFGAKCNLEKISTENIIKKAQNAECIEKTKLLLEAELNESVNSLSSVDKSIFRTNIEKLCYLFKC